MNARALAIVGVILASSPIAASAQARHDSLGAGWGQQQNEARKGVQEGNVSLAQVIANIERKSPGHILDAGLESGADGRQLYRVRWAAADGRRIDYLVDARTGAVLRAGGG